MDASELQALYARCDPYEVLPADDVDRYVDIEHVTDATTDPEALRPRRHAWVKLISGTFKLSRPDHEQRVLTLIQRSGGYPRELVTMLRKAIEAQRFPLSDGAFKRVLADRADEYWRKVSSVEARDLLRQIMQRRGRLMGPAEQQDVLEQLLTRSLVFVYQNEVEWADVNPALASDLQEP